MTLTAELVSLTSRNESASGMIQINQMIILDEEDSFFDKERRRLLQKSSSEELLAFKLEVIEMLGLVEIHSKPTNRVARWWNGKLASLLVVVEDVIHTRVKEWHE